MRKRMVKTAAHIIVTMLFLASGTLMAQTGFGFRAGVSADPEKDLQQFQRNAAGMAASWTGWRVPAGCGFRAILSLIGQAGAPEGRSHA